VKDLEKDAKQYRKYVAPKLQSLLYQRELNAFIEQAYIDGAKRTIEKMKDAYRAKLKEEPESILQLYERVAFIELAQVNEALLKKIEELQNDKD